jgi:site-specific recombinase XerD
MTLSKAMSEYLRHRAVYSRSSPGSIEQYDRTYRMFLGFLQGRGLPDEPRSFSADMVREWGLSEGERGVGPRTLSSRFGALSSLAEYMLRLKDGRNRPLLAEHPLRGMDWPKYRKPESKFLHPDELRAFLSTACRPHENLARDLLLDTMCRVSEIANANVGDIEGPDSSGQYDLRVRVKGGQEKRVPLSPEVASALQDALLARGAVQRTDALLVNSRRQRWTRTGLSQLMVRLGEKAGIKRFKVSAHKLRHTSATIALASGADLKEVSELLNHSKIETTAQYLHLIPGSLHAARAKQRAGLKGYLNG